MINRLAFVEMLFQNRSIRNRSENTTALLTPKHAEQVQLEFKRLAHEAGIKGARINVQRVVADDYEKVISEAKACLRTAMPKAA